MLLCTHISPKCEICRRWEPEKAKCECECVVCVWSCGGKAFWANSNSSSFTLWILFTVDISNHTCECTINSYEPHLLYWAQTYTNNRRLEDWHNTIVLNTNSYVIYCCRDDLRQHNSIKIHITYILIVNTYRKKKLHNITVNDVILHFPLL